MANNPIPYGRQNITDADIKAVVEALKSDYLTQGPRVLAFENAFAKYVEAKFAVAVANGTAALHLNTIALNVKPGTKVITSPLTFAATANAVRYCGGEVVFADIDPTTYLLDINKVEKILEKAPKGTYSGIMPIDFAGRAVDLEAFKELADKHNMWIIEDACHAPGGYFRSKNGEKQLSGNGKFADLAIFSFHPVKHIAAGEGGMITTNDEKLYKRLLEVRTHGITRDISKYVNSPAIAHGNARNYTGDNYPGWYMEMQELGYNYRLTDFQAALGQSQLGRADEGLAQRKKIAKKYKDAFAEIEPIIDRNLELSSDEGHAFHLYVIEVENRREIYDHLRKNNIFAQIHYIPLHLMPYYQALGYKPGDFPKAENYYARCISLPMYPTLTESEQDFVIETLKAYFEN